PQIYFSLVDYRNNYFLSKEPNKIIRFDDSIDSRNNPTEEINEKPKGSYEMIEIGVVKNIIIVKLAKYSITKNNHFRFTGGIVNG
ncbi:MAG: hypothetical protein ACP5U0_08600, partial [Caldisphaera sp.]